MNNTKPDNRSVKEKIMTRCMMNYRELSARAKKRAVSQWVEFVNVDGSLDNLTSVELVKGCFNSDYHFTPQGSLYRDENGNVL